MTPNEPEIPLGGAVTDAVRIGNRVHRPVGPGTTAVIDLLDHLEERGFHGSPRVVGFDDAGRVMLTWLEGETCHEDEISDEGLRQVGALLRRYHDLVADYQPSAAFEEGPRQARPGLIVCHGDIAPRNTIFHDGRLACFVDWDGAFLAYPLWDLAHAVWQFTPIRPARHPDGQLYELAQQLARAQALVDGYGPSAQQRPVLHEWIRNVIRGCRHGVENKAAEGQPAFVALVDRGVLDELDLEARYAEENAGALADALNDHH